MAGQTAATPVRPRDLNPAVRKKVGAGSVKTIAQFYVSRQEEPNSYTLVEVIIAIALTGVVMGGIISGYLMSARHAEWSAYSLAAHSLVLQRIEQTRAAKCTPRFGIDELTADMFPTNVDILDIPMYGTNYPYATTSTTIKLISADPVVKMIQVHCIWQFKGRDIYTNTVAVYRTVDR